MLRKFFFNNYYFIFDTIYFLVSLLSLVVLTLAAYKLCYLLGFGEYALNISIFVFVLMLPVFVVSNIKDKFYRKFGFRYKLLKEGDTVYLLGYFDKPERQGAPVLTGKIINQKEASSFEVSCNEYLNTSLYKYYPYRFYIKNMRPDLKPLCCIALLEDIMCIA